MTPASLDGHFYGKKEFQDVLITSVSTRLTNKVNNINNTNMIK